MGSYNLVGSVYNSLLDNNSGDHELQKNILSYGVRVKDYDLLVKLAKSPNLSPEIDNELKEIPAVAVKAAWATKKGRSDEEIISLITKEKRIKVLQALAEREDLPEVIYKTIVSKAKGIGALVAIVSNSKVSLEVKKEATDKLILEFGKNIDGEGLQSSSRMSLVSQILAQSPELALQFAEKSQHLGVLQATVKSVPLSDTAQENLLRLLKESVEFTEKKERNQVWNKLSTGSFAYITTFIDPICNYGNINSNVKSELLSMLKRIYKKHKDNTYHYYNRTIEESIEQLKNTTSKVRVNFIEKIAKIKSNEEIVKVIDEVIKYWEQSRYDNVAETASFAIIASEFSNEDDINKLLKSISVGWYSVKNLKKITSSPEKIGVIIAHYPYMGVDDVLKITSNPELALSTAIKYKVMNDEFLPAELLESKYLNEKVAESLPLSAFLNNSTPILVKNYLSNIMRESFTSKEEWITFEAMGDEFEGSIKDLIGLVKNL